MEKKSAPTKAAPTKAAPTKAAPTKPAPTKPAPTKPAPTKAAPTKEAPTKPAPTKPAPTKPEPPKVVPNKESPSKPTPPQKTIPTKAAPTKAAPTKAAPTKASPQKKDVPANKAGVKGKSTIVEEKKLPEALVVTDKKKPAIIEIKLPAIDQTLKEIWSRNKFPLIMDTTGNYTTFLKYKGSQADYTEYSLLEKMGKKTKADFIEEVRKFIYISMKNGHTFALFLDKTIVNLKDFFKDAPFFVIPDVLTPTKVQSPEFYKAKLLKPEEDEDSFGNKGCFKLRDEFNMCLLFHTDNWEEISKGINLPLDLFEVLTIIPN